MAPLVKPAVNKRAPSNETGFGMEDAEGTAATARCKGENGRSVERKRIAFFLWQTISEVNAGLRKVSNRQFQSANLLIEPAT